MKRGTLFRALSWSMGGRLLHLLISLGTNIWLMRLIVPAAFGKLALVAVGFAFLEGVRDFGTLPSLVQQKQVNTTEVRSLYSFQLVLGLLGCLPPLVVYVFQADPELKLLLLLGTVHFFLGSLLGLPIALWERALQFDRIILGEVLGLLIAAVVGILLAYAAWPIWALGIRQPLRLFLIFISVCWWRGLILPGAWQWSSIRKHLRFGGPLTVDGLLNFAVRNLDDLLIGRVLGYQALGWYNRAYQILLFPIRNVSRTLARVFFPAVAPLQDQPRLVFERYRELSQLLWTGAVPAFTGLFLVADPLFPALVGAEWQSLVPVIQVFCVLGVFQMVGTLEGTVFQILGATRIQMRLGLWLKPLLLASIGLSLWLGQSIWWVAVSYTCASIVAVVIGWSVLCRLMEVPVANLWRSLWPAIEANGAGLAAYGAIFLIGGGKLVALLVFALVFGSYLYFRFPKLIHNWQESWVRLRATAKG